MFNSVQYVRKICKERKIPVSQLERACGFANGYLNPKKMAKISYDRAVLIADFLGLSAEEILNGPDKNKMLLVNDDEELTEYIQMLKTRPECRMLFQLSRNATKEDVEAAVRIIEALRNK